MTSQQICLRRQKQTLNKSIKRWISHGTSVHTKRLKKR
ncbi:hypothetical protein MGSAQ_001890 [marine sediment metagenome]|uniref:Uncharacterized protein n=1 Tax=marine sediment metagenome TaxID=412755 RepID=A0A1B6NT18_9ZZZZ